MEWVLECTAANAAAEEEEEGEEEAGADGEEGYQVMLILLGNPCL